MTIQYITKSFKHESFSFNRKCTERLAGVRSKDKRLAHEVIGDIKIIATYSIDKDTLMFALGQMFKKYRNGEEVDYDNPETKLAVFNFLAYFRDEWVRKPDNFRWFQGANPGHIITNNACERGNKTIKENFTQGYRLGLEDLIDKVNESIISKNRS